MPNFCLNAWEKVSHNDKNARRGEHVVAQLLQQWVGDITQVKANSCFHIILFPLFILFLKKNNSHPKCLPNVSIQKMCCNHFMGSDFSNVVTVTRK